MKKSILLLAAGLSTLGHLNPNIYPTSAPAAASAIQQLLNAQGAGGASTILTQTTGSTERVKKAPPNKAPAKKVTNKSLPKKSSKTDDA